MRPQLKIRSTFSRDYEGSPVAGAVKIPVRDTDVSVKNYDIKNGVELSQSATTYMNVPIDNHKAINELIDGYEAAAVPDNLRAQRLESGSYVLASTLEADAIATLLTGTASTQPDSTASNVYENILRDISILAKKGVDKNRMYVAVDYATETLLLLDERYSNSASQIGSELAREGVVNKINGVKVITQDLGTTSDGKTVEYAVYGVDWTQAIDEWKINPSIVDIKDGKHIGASALQGRMVYADVLTNKNAVIYKATQGAAETNIMTANEDAVDEVVEKEVKDIAKMTKAELIAYAKSNNIEIDENSNKDVILAAILETTDNE